MAATPAADPCPPWGFTPRRRRADRRAVRPSWLRVGRIAPPREHARAVEREPLGRLAGRHVDLEPHPPGVTVFLQPGAIGAAGRADGLDRVRESWIGRGAVVQR